MQDFAKQRLTRNTELPRPQVERVLDPFSVLFGLLIGAIVMCAGIKVSEHRDTQSQVTEITEQRFSNDHGIKIQFYEELKRDDLYPPMQSDSSN